MLCNNFLNELHLFLRPNQIRNKQASQVIFWFWFLLPKNHSIENIYVSSFHRRSFLPSHFPILLLLLHPPCYFCLFIFLFLFSSFSFFHLNPELPPSSLFHKTITIQLEPQKLQQCMQYNIRCIFNNKQIQQQKMHITTIKLCCTAFESRNLF